MVGIPGLLQLVLTGMTAAQGGGLDLAAMQSAAGMIGAALAVAGLGHKTDKGTRNIVNALGQVATVVEAASEGAKAVTPIKPR